MAADAASIRLGKPRVHSGVAARRAAFRPRGDLKYHPAREGVDVDKEESMPYAAPPFALMASGRR